MIVAKGHATEASTLRDFVVAVLLVWVIIDIDFRSQSTKLRLQKQKNGLFFCLNICPNSYIYGQLFSGVCISGHSLKIPRIATMSRINGLLRNGGERGIRTPDTPLERITV
jgi:hypothetical protein